MALYNIFVKLFQSSTVELSKKGKMCYIPRNLYLKDPKRGIMKNAWAFILG